MGTGDYIPDPLRPNANRGALYYAYALKDATLPELSGNADRECSSHLGDLYRRWQFYFEESFPMDDISQSTVTKLCDSAEEFIEEKYASDNNEMNKLIEYLNDYEKTPESFVSSIRVARGSPLYSTPLRSTGVNNNEFRSSKP